MNPILTPFAPIFELFENDLAEVQFADLDARVLARVASEVESAAEAVALAEAALDGARGALREAMETLVQHGHRALAYARVYAENDDALTSRLEAIALPRPARRARGPAPALVLAPDSSDSPVRSEPRRRGRPRRAEPTEATLALVAPAE